MSKVNAMGLVCATLLLGGCCALRDSESVEVRKRCPDEVVIFTTPPAKSYREVGTVTSPGGNADAANENYHRMQARAAGLGADAVILTDWVPEPPTEFWQSPHTGVAISYTVSQL